MALSDDNPLSGTEELSGESHAFRDELADTEYYVDDLQEAIDAEVYDTEQLEALREIEEARNEPRKTALDALEEVTDATTEASKSDNSEDEIVEPATSTTPTTSAAERNSCGASPAIQRATQGAGATESGAEGVCLPNPYGEDTPDTVRIFVPTAMGFGGMFFPDKGVYDVAYATDPDDPSDETRGMQVKHSLESQNNPVHLSRNDPLHPNYGDEDE